MSERDNAPEEVGERINREINVAELLRQAGEIVRYTETLRDLVEGGTRSLISLLYNVDEKRVKEFPGKWVLTILTDRDVNYLALVNNDGDRILVDRIIDGKFEFGMGNLFDVKEIFIYDTGEEKFAFAEPRIVGGGIGKKEIIFPILGSVLSFPLSFTLDDALLFNSFMFHKNKKHFLSLLSASVLSKLLGFAGVVPKFYIPEPMFMLLSFGLYYLARKLSKRQILNLDELVEYEQAVGKEFLLQVALALSNILYLNRKIPNSPIRELNDVDRKYNLLYSPEEKVLYMVVKGLDDNRELMPLYLTSLKYKVKILSCGERNGKKYVSFMLPSKVRRKLRRNLLKIEKKGKKVTLARILSLSLGFAGSHVNTYLGELNLSFKDLDYINGKYVGAKEHKLYKLLKVNEGAYLSSFLSGNPLKKILSREEDVSFCLIYINGRFYFPARHVEIKKGKYVVSDPVFVDGRNFFVKRNYFVNVEGITTRLIKEGKIKVKLIGTYLDNRILTNNMPSEDNLNIAYILEVNSEDVKKELKKFKKKISS